MLSFRISSIRSHSLREQAVRAFQRTNSPEQLEQEERAEERRLRKEASAHVSKILQRHVPASILSDTLRGKRFVSFCPGYVFSIDGLDFTVDRHGKFWTLRLILWGEDGCPSSTEVYSLACLGRLVEKSSLLAAA